MQVGRIKVEARSHQKPPTFTKKKIQFKKSNHLRSQHRRVILKEENVIWKRLKWDQHKYAGTGFAFSELKGRDKQAKGRSGGLRASACCFYTTISIHQSSHGFVLLARSCKNAGDRSVSRRCGVTSPSYCMCSDFIITGFLKTANLCFVLFF